MLTLLTSTQTSPDHRLRLDLLWPNSPISLHGWFALLLLWLAQAGGAKAAPAQRLLSFDTVWRYEESGDTNNTLWKTPDYDDSGWKQGPGPFFAPATASPDRIGKPGTRMHNGGAPPKGDNLHRFRTRFNWDDTLEAVSLVASNHLWDGAVYYLNGEEIGRTNVVISKLTETGFNYFDLRVSGVFQLELSSKSLVRGENVIAVELFQTDTNSVVAIFATELWAEHLARGLPVIRSHPADVEVLSGNPFSLKAPTKGALPLNYQWFKDAQPIPNATNSTHTVTNSSIDDSGSYALKALNALGQSVSRNAVVTVLASGLVSPNQTWRYDISGNNLGTTWADADYDDSFWRSGVGPFGNESFEGSRPLPYPIETHLPRRVPITTYFRTSFDWNRPLDHVELEFMFMVDDGVIFHLNGSELLRYGLGENAINHNSLSFQRVGDPEWVTVSVPSHKLVQGQNVLAAELHQFGEHTRDATFALRLHPLVPPPTRLQILNQPEDQTVAEGTEINLMVEVLGAGAVYQWHRNDQPVPGANLPTLLIRSAKQDLGASYRVEITNMISRITSREASVKVIADNIPPRLVEADGTLDPTTLRIEFSEPVSSNSLIDVANYRLTNAIGAELAIMQMEPLGDTAVSLTTAARDPAIDHWITVRGVSDTSAQQNEVATGSSVRVGHRAPLVRLSDDWLYRVDDLQEKNDWLQSGYRANDWKIGTSTFVQRSGDLEEPQQEGTTLGTVNHSVRLRKEFVIDPGAALCGLVLRHLVDDGAVFYLNGTECARFNIPNAPVTPLTRARSRVTSVHLSAPVSLPCDLLRTGTNVLAVSLHRDPIGDRDLTFACELVSELRFPSAPAPPSTTPDPDRSGSPPPGLLIGFDAAWRYDQSGKPPAENWHMVEFDDKPWPSGPALLGDENTQLGHPVKTRLRAPSAGGPVTTYFRHRFSLEEDTQEDLLLQYYLDDGGVVYLNGNEVHRKAVAVGQIPTSLASRQVMNTDMEGPFSIDPSHLQRGDNVLAVEVHQSHPKSLDVVFGAELYRAPSP